MDGNWQLVVVTLVVSFAIWRLLRRALAAWRTGDGQACGSCSSCSDTSEKRLPLVELDADGDSSQVLPSKH